MDHMMPGLDGVEAARRIRKLPNAWAQDIPIIALSANAVSGAREAFLNAGMNDFISKPIDAAGFNRKLAQWLPSEKISVIAEPLEENAAEKDEPGIRPAVLDRVRGIRKIGGDEALYEQLISAFKEDHFSDYEKIREALNAGDFSRAHRIAHTLKSTAGLIGATRLQDAALAVETALAREAAPPPELLPALEGELHALRGILNAGEQRPPQEASPETPPPPPGGKDAEERKKALDLIGRLVPLLQSGNTASLDLLGEIRETLPAYTDKGALLIKQIEDFEFKSALETIMELRSTFDL
jgi:CheY-like chemotaxis protein